MTLTVIDLLRDKYEFCCLLPAEGRMTEELRARGVEYILIGDQTLPAGVKSRCSVFRYAAMSARCIFRSLCAVRKFKPDILYAPGPAALPWSAVCGALTGRPTVWHLHHIFLDGMTVKLLNLCAGFRSVKRIIAVSSSTGAQITAKDACGKISVIYNPVDFEKYSGGEPSGVISEIEAALGRSLDKEKTVVLAQIALMQRSKRQELVIELVSRLRNLGYDAVGVFLGETREPDYREKCETLVRELGIEDSVALWERREDVPDVLAAADLLILPSSLEGLPLAGLEAACAGVPFVSCDLAGARELAEVSGGGTTFKFDDIASATEAVVAALDDREKLSEHGREFARSCNMQSYGEKIDCLFSSLL